jgi:hypothetical protein
MDQEAGRDAVLDFLEGGKPPAGFDFSHSYSAAANPEVAGRPDLGQLMPHDDHIAGVHGNDTRVPLFGLPRNPDYDGPGGFQVMPDTPEGRSYAGMTDHDPAPTTPIFTIHFGK